jgi:hypothetical protein
VRQTGAVSKTFRVARNPDASSALPFVIDVPLPSGSMILKAKASWPRTAKIYCHPLDEWPEHAEVLEIVVDTRERYAWKFAEQQATTTRRALTVGDYAVELDGDVVGVIERKTLADLAARLVDGSLLLLLGELAAMPRAAIVVEDRWADVFRLSHVSPSMVAEMLAGAQVRYPNVPIVFCETRPLAQEWAYRFLGAALALADETTLFGPDGDP